MKKLLIGLAFAAALCAQQVPTSIYPVLAQNGPPTSACPGMGVLDIDIVAHQIYSCSVAGGAWFISSGAGGTGQAAAYAVVAFSATPIFTAVSNTSDTFKITLTGNVTGSTVLGATTNEEITFDVCQNATGGWTFANPSGFAKLFANMPLSLTPLACTKQVGFWDGANWQPKANPTSDETPFVVTLPTRTPPSAPGSGFIKPWADVTCNLLMAVNFSSVVSSTLTLAGGSGSIQTNSGGCNLSGNANDTLDTSGSNGMKLRYGLQTGGAGTGSGGVVWGGLTSGQNGFGVNDVAGNMHIGLMPTVAGTLNQLFSISALNVACPSGALFAGLTCDQLTWVTPSGGTSTCITTTGQGYYMPWGPPQGNSVGTAFTANQVAMWEFMVPCQMTISKLDFMIGTADNAKHVTFAIYNASNSAIVSNGQCATASSNGSNFQAQTCSFPGAVTLTPGTYFLGFSTDSAATLKLNIVPGGSTWANTINQLETGAVSRMMTCSNASGGSSTITMPSGGCGTRTTATGGDSLDPPAMFFLP